MNSDLLSYFLVRNEPIRTVHIGAMAIGPALTFTNQPINLLPLEIDSKQEAGPGNQEKTRQREKPSGLVMGLAWDEPGLFSAFFTSQTSNSG